MQSPASASHDQSTHTHIAADQHIAPLRVLYLMEGFDAGGAERRFVRMARGLDRERFALSVAALRLGGPLETEMRACGVPIVPLERRGRFDVQPVLRLRRYLRAERIQVVHAMHWLSNLTAALAAATLPHVAIVGSTVGMVYTASRGGRYRLALDRRLTWRRLDRMTVNSASLRDYLASCDFPAERLSLVLNGVDIPTAADLSAARAEARTHLGIAPGAPVAGIVARLSPVKDHGTFLRAARIVRGRLPGAHFVVAGDGPERAALETLAGELGLGDSVLFTGHIPSSDLVLPALDVAVLCSRHEGMPNALLEASAWAVPQVATAVGGVPEVVLNGQTGLLTPAGDAETLAARMLALLTDRALAERLGRAAREHIAATFSTNTMIRRYEAIYTAVAAARSGSSPCGSASYGAESKTL
ncbi:MAG TPA: glycosyltransferase [Ktedonobacterales bacterium]|nr:glycosyltransferase [Ktedonobacterales bacterium]